MTVHINNKFSVGKGNPLCVIAGPCQIESFDHACDIAGTMKEICQDLGLNFVYKSSFDKANRTSASTPRGPGLEKGLEILSNVKRQIDVPTLTDIHTPYHATAARHYQVDVIQIPAFLSRQTDLLIAAGESKLVVNIKKGQFMAPMDIYQAAAKIASTGNDQILLCERGVTHGYNNLVVDMRSLPIMALSGYPVVFDCTHSVQQPGGLGTSSGGDRRMVPYLARAAVATGSVDAVFIETHENPEAAPSDGPNMVPLKHMRELLTQLRDLHSMVANLHTDLLQ
jgi:2-dehydro-3-deoxyphosphooctonate aldolase (KDO 8-P synthase)